MTRSDQDLDSPADVLTGIKSFDMVPAPPMRLPSEREQSIAVRPLQRAFPLLF